jgi:uncharacterized protein
MGSVTRDMRSAKRVSAMTLGSIFALCSVITWMGWMSVAVADTAQDLARAQKLLDEGDVARAMPVLRRMADEGYAPAQARLAHLLDKAEENAAAVGYFRKAADQGDADGAFGLGSMYVSGEGVARDMSEALRWMRIAAAKSHVQAINFLAQAYLAPEPALKAEADYSEQAVRWETLAADQGFVPAMDGLAQAYRSGNWGLKPDEATARTWQSRAETARRSLESKVSGKAEKQP